VTMNLFVQPLGRNLRFFHSVRIQTIQSLALVSCPRNKHIFRCDQNGPPARREEGAYLERCVTDEQRSRRPIFIATPWAASSWLFLRVARFSRIDSDMLVARALKKQPTDLRRKTCLFRGQDISIVSRQRIRLAEKCNAYIRMPDRPRK